MSNDHSKHEKEIDKVSGVETTGHEWDGLKELNNPLPRWWLWVWAVCCLWAFWYFIVYPAWPIPGGATPGTSGYTSYKELELSQKQIAERQDAYRERFETADFDTILDDQELYAFAMAGGAAAFKDNCATCHGTGAAGGPGFPNLNDDDWIWGGQLQTIHETLLHGIRWASDFESRVSQMPSFGRDGLLNRDEINAVVDYVLSLSAHLYDDQNDASASDSHSSGHDGHGVTSAVNTNEKDAAVMVARLEKGAEIFAQNCASCHGAQGKGMHDVGAPNLTDAIWLYGGTREDVYQTIYYSRAGVMPAWKDRLDENTIRQLAIYVHQLGGGEASE